MLSGGEEEKPVEFLQTPWATSCLVYEGFLYNLHSGKPNGTKYWRCHNYSKKDKESRCKARCILVHDEVKMAPKPADHNHGPQLEKIARFKKKQQQQRAHEREEVSVSFKRMRN